MEPSEQVRREYEFGVGTIQVIAFRSHWQFAAQFCSLAQPQEKGGVENEAGTFRRHHFAPVPCAKDLADPYAYLMRCCREDEARQTGDSQQSVGERMLTEWA